MKNCGLECAAIHLVNYHDEMVNYHDEMVNYHDELKE